MLVDGSASALSISIVTYNTQIAVLESVLSRIASSTVDANVYVVDNSPSSHLAPIVGTWGATYLHAGRNRGYGCAHNIALRQLGSKSRYHLILNPDISFGPRVLEELCSFLEANPEVGWVMPTVLYPDGSEQQLCKRLPTPWNLLFRRFVGTGFGAIKRSLDRFECQDLDLTQPRVIPNLSGCFALVRTDLLRDLGGFDERFFLYLEDTDLVRRVGERAFTVFYPFTSVYHTHGRGSYRSVRLLVYHIASAIKYFGKWGWFVDHRRSLVNRAIESDTPNRGFNRSQEVALVANLKTSGRSSPHRAI